MKNSWTPLAVVYLGLAIVGLVGTFVLNAWSVVAGRDYLGDLFGSGPAVSSIGVDLLIVAVAGAVLIVAEARRLGMKRAWLYIALSLVTAFAFTFPLFLAMRERRLRAIATGRPGSAY
ncbi:DUF2834 domain-containing protein [Microbacterium atlanticum]|uniref:DUF2834 domain-containing protein n=1 Tax=Microbacterium atlanticum TaxID=2782168 RepID=UPI001887F839|nr:DUF2834 domain-containing protein [Microbacterium atlanticum]